MFKKMTNKRGYPSCILGLPEFSTKKLWPRMQCMRTAQPVLPRWSFSLICLASSCRENSSVSSPRVPRQIAERPRLLLLNFLRVYRKSLAGCAGKSRNRSARQVPGFFPQKSASSQKSASLLLPGSLLILQQRGRSSAETHTSWRFLTTSRFLPTFPFLSHYQALTLFHVNVLLKRMGSKIWKILQRHLNLIK